MTLCRITDFFAKRSVLLTGGTGFIGMALIEGLLSSSPDLYRVYVLVREKKGLSPENRISRLLSSEIFNHLPSEVKAKVVPVMGEITAENLGLSPEILAEIRENVSVVYHNAGLIKFNRSLCEAVKMNLLTTLRCIDLAKSLKHLSAFVYSSTALANSNVTGKISEEVYKTKRSPREMIKLALEAPSSLDRVAEIKEDFIEGHQNSYTYSKQLAENLILEEMSGYPAGMVRPALVFGFYDHQIPGWLGKSKSGHCGLIKAHIKGVCRSMFAETERVCISVPCDFVVKGILALTVSLGTQPVSQLPEIIHISNTKSVNPLTNGQFCNVLNEESWKNPCDSYVFLPRCKPRIGWRANLYLMVCYFIALLFYIPENLFNFSPNWLRGINMITIQFKASKHFIGLSTCITDFHIEKCQELTRSLHPDDQRAYTFDIAKVNWNRLFGSSISWARKYYFKDSCSVTWMHRVVQIGCLIVEGMWYFSIFFATTFSFLVVGLILQYSILYVLLIGLAFGISLSAFALWL